MAAGMVSTPFPADAVAAQPQSAHNDLAALTSATGDAGKDRQTIVDEVRRTVLEDVDVKLSDKMKDLWSRGNKMLKQIEHENQEHSAKLLEELTQRQQKQEALRAEQEHLRTLLTSMVTQFSMLGAIYSAPSTAAGPAGAAGTISPTASAPSAPSTPCLGFAATGSAAGDASTASGAASTGLADSPQQETGASAYAGAAFPPLPAMPEFPFPPLSADLLAAPPGIATPLSLMEALGSETPMSSAPPSFMSPLQENIFSFTLRKADGTDLGINVSHHEHDKVLRVEGVRPEGAVEAWNRQCMGSAMADKTVLSGDKILSVNGIVGEPARMLEECRDRQLLKFTVMRGTGGGLFAAPPTPVATPTTTTLRADACEFVPLRADAQEFVPADFTSEQQASGNEVAGVQT